MKYAWALACGAVLFLITGYSVHLLRPLPMNEIKFDLGKNIVEIARESGVPKYVARDVDGLISYNINDLSPSINATFVREKYSVSFGPLFAFTMYADKENKNNLGVENVTLQFSSAPYKTHQEGKQFVEAIIQQMHAKHWTRYIDELCPAVTGRSSFTNALDKLEQVQGCALDPAYILTQSEWVEMMSGGQSYQWSADGVLATLRVGFSNDSRGITYNLFMDFDEVTTRNRKDAEHLKRDLKDGDKKGWNSSAKYEKDIKKLKELVKVLEANAARRGDSIVPR